MEEIFSNSGFALMIGIPGCGKSRYIKTLNHDNIKIISLDNIRKYFAGDISNIKVDKAVWKIATDLIINNINNGFFVILDATNVNTKYRRKLIKSIKSNINENIKIYYKLFESDPEVSKERIKNDIFNNIDRSHVPDYVIDNMYDYYLKTLKVIDKEGLIKID